MAQNYGLFVALSNNRWIHARHVVAVESLNELGDATKQDAPNGMKTRLSLAGGAYASSGSDASTVVQAVVKVLAGAAGSCMVGPTRP